MRLTIDWQNRDTLIHRIGSPFGFGEWDWEYVLRERQNLHLCKVVFGYQFHSQHYDTEKLKQNLQSQFTQALASLGHSELLFVPLAAGYGEHLFTDIIRDIISADIAVFETSDKNPNVMIELGVALTWGVSVWLIKKGGTGGTPTDVAGLSWAEYDQDGEWFRSQDHMGSLRAMIDRAMRKKVAK